MTTFTTQDRVDAEITVEPIPFAGMVQLQDKEDLIAVLKANNKIQLEINAKQFEYIAELEKALESSLALNKAQAERQDK
jgi:hypothetical protein